MKTINSANTLQHIYISAGEPSGDFLGATLAQSLLQKDPTLKLTGMGGKKMRDAGVSLQFDYHALSVVGIVEIIKHLPAILSALRDIKNYIHNNKPDLLILIDFPDTHCRLLKTAKKLGIPVLYYVSPQVWAWRSGRIQQLKKYVDHMAVLFLFEEKIYQDAKIPVTFVGHPLGNTVKPALSVEEAYATFSLHKAHPIVALLPGSRESELHHHLSIIIDSTTLILKKYPDAQFVLLLSSHFSTEKIQATLPAHIRIIQHHLYDVLQISTAAIAVSGTITLEVALMHVPMCIIYKLNALTYWIVKKLIRVKHIGLCNVVSEKQIAKEFIQGDATPDNISTEVNRILSDEAYREAIKKEMGAVRALISIDDKNASDSVADIAIKLLRV